MSAVRADAPVLPLIVITAIAAGLRFTLIGHQGYWLDEGITVQLLHDSFLTMLGALPHRESTPPLFYLLGWVWARIFGFSEAGVRSLSAVLGVVTVPVAYAAAAHAVSRRVGLITASLTASSPLLVWYSQEARPYALLVLLCALSVLTFEAARSQPSARLFLAWALVSMLALLAHYFAAMIVVPEAVWLLVEHRQRWAVWLGVSLVGAVGAALIPLAHRQQRFTTWISLLALSVRLRQLSTQFLLGFAVPASRFLWYVALAVVIVSIALLVWRGAQCEVRGAVGMAALATAGFAIAMASRITGSDVINTRNLIELWLPLAIFVSAGLGVARAGPLGLAGTVVLCGIGIAGTVYIDADRSVQRPDWRPISAALGPPPMSGARVVVLLRYGSPFPLILYRPELQRITPHWTERVREVDFIRVEHAHSSFACWWGAACQLRGARLRGHPPSVSGFKQVAVVWRSPFELIRFQALTAQRETVATIMRWIPAMSRPPRSRVLFESSRIGGPFGAATR